MVEQRPTDPSQVSSGSALIYEQQRLRNRERFGSDYYPGQYVRGEWPDDGEEQT